MVLYGPSGVGKSSLVAEFQDVAFICDPRELGIQDLIQFGQAKQPKMIETVTGWKHLLKTTEKMCTAKNIHTVAYDSLTGLQHLCFAYHCETYFNNDWTKEGFYAFSQGPKNAAQRDWPHFIDACENLRQCGKNVVLIGHSHVKPFRNPSGPDYDRFVPALEKEIWGVTHTWATAVLFYRYNVETEKISARFKGKSETQTRQICCIHEQAEYDAKNRYGLPSVILAGESSAEAYAALKRHYRGVI